MEYGNLEERVFDMVAMGYEKFLWGSDFHVPFHDTKLYTEFVRFAEEQKPDTIVIGGDFMDFYAVSKFDKNPRRIGQLQEELDKGHELLQLLREHNPDSKIVYLEGNHEERMTKYLVANPELYGLRNLEIPNLLGLKELGIDYRTHLLHKGFLFKHGNYVNKYSANKELDVEGVSGMSGHTHRNQTLSKTLRSGTITWHNIGHLCDESKTEYIKGVANWQQGLAMVYFKKNGTWSHVHTIPVDNSRFIYGDMIYSAKK